MSSLSTGRNARTIAFTDVSDAGTDAGIASLPRVRDPLHYRAIVSACEHLCRHPSPANAAALEQLVPEFRIVLGGNPEEFPALPGSPESARPSERICGQVNRELDRLLTSMRSYFDLKEGGDACTSFAASQPEESRITRDTFNSMSELIRSLIDTDEKEALLLLGLVYNTGAKVSTTEWIKAAHLDPESPHARQTVTVCEQARAESDDHVAVLRSILSVAPELAQTLNGFFQGEARSHFSKAHTETPNLGQLMLLESMEATLTDYPELSDPVKALHYAHSLLLVCGARGHEPGIGSMTMVEHIAQQWITAHTALSNSDAREIYRAILEERASLYGFDPRTGEGRALVRLSAMLGVGTKADASQVREIFKSTIVTAEDRRGMIAELNRDGLQGPAAILVRYLPATLTNITQAASERRCERQEALAIAFRTCAYMLKVGREMITSESGYETITARNVAKNARVLPLAPAGCITVAREKGGVAFSIDPEWLTLTVHAPEVSSTRVSLAPLEQSPHIAYGQIHDAVRELKQHLQSAMLAREYSDAEMRSMALQVATLVHKLAFISLFVPRQFEPPDVEIVGRDDSSASLVERAHVRLRALVAEMREAVELNQLSDFENNPLESIDRDVEAIKALIDGVLAKKSERTVSFGREGEHEYFTVSRGPDAETTFRFLPLSGWGAMNTATNEVGEYGPLVSMLEITRSGSTGLSHDQELALFRRFIGPAAAIYAPFVDLDRDGAPKRLVRGAAAAFLYRVSVLRRLASETQEQAGRACDAIVLLSGGLMDSRTPQLERIAEHREKTIAACRDWVVDPSVAHVEKMLEARNDFNSHIPTAIKLDAQYTYVVTKNSPEVDDVVAQLGAIASRYAKSPHDSEFSRSGGFATSVTPAVFSQIVRAGGEIIVCRDANARIIGGLLHIPHHALSRGSATALLDLYQIYGRPSVISHMLAVHDVGVKLPVYALLTSRYRLEAFGHDLTTFVIADANRRSLAMNLSVAGRGVIHPAHRPVLASANRAASTGIRERVEAPNLIGAMAPLAPEMAVVFDSTRLSDSGAVRLADMVVHHQVPGLFKRDMADLMRVFARVTSSIEQLAITVEDASERQKQRRELQRVNLKAWCDEVVAYLAVLDEVSDETRTGPELYTLEQVLQVAERVAKRADGAKIREFINKSPLGR